MFVFSYYFCFWLVSIHFRHSKYRFDACICWASVWNVSSELNIYFPFLRYFFFRRDFHLIICLLSSEALFATAVFSIFETIKTRDALNLNLNERSFCCKSQPFQVNDAKTQKRIMSCTKRCTHPMHTHTIYQFNWNIHIFFFSSLF